jgi:peptidoglycan/LPS O-acetylase OafA/YrhL
MDVSSAREAPLKRAPSQFDLPELDLLRFLAFLMVFVCHVIPTQSAHVGPVMFAIREAGTFGVPVFFALSAFLITELLFREKDRTGTVHFGSFYVRRILRIWPLYFGVLFAAFAISRVAPGSTPIPLMELAAYVGLVGNWYSLFRGALPLGLDALWSIGIEEQFYLVWPSVVRIATRKGMLAASCAIWAISQIVVAAICSRHVGFPTVWLNTFAQMQYFAIGAGLSVALHGRIPRFGIAPRIALVLGGLLVFVVIHRQETVTTYLPYLTAGLGTLLLFFGFLGMRVPAARYLRFPGKISYAMYVFHLPVLNFTSRFASQRLHMTHNVFILKVAVALPVVFLLAALSYRYYETPFLKLKKRFEIVKSRPI